MRIPIAAALLSLLLLAPAFATAPVETQSGRYLAGSSVPFIAPDATLSRAHACASSGGDVNAWYGCRIFWLGNVPEGDYDVTLSVVDDVNPLVAFDWQVWREDCPDWSCAGDACGAPAFVQADAVGSVTFRVHAPCGNVWVWPGNGATQGVASMVVVPVGSG